MQDRPQPILDHLQELRTRIIWSFVAIVVGICISAFYAERALGLLLASAKQGTEIKLVTTSLSETFMVEFRLAIYGGLVLAAPFVLYQLLAFVLPGLLPNERRILYMGLPAALFLFLGGVGFGWFVAVPLCKSFFFQVSSGVGVEQLITPEAYLNFVLDLCIPLGLSFQAPFLIFILAKLGLVTAPFLARVRKYAFLIILIIAAILSPPDLVSMAIFFVPLYGLYEFSILVASLAAPKQEMKGRSLQR
jgi:sec-independent protein translocase protein TatC